MNSRSRCLLKKVRILPGVTTIDFQCIPFILPLHGFATTSGTLSKKEIYHLCCRLDRESDLDIDKLNLHSVEILSEFFLFSQVITD